MGLELNLDYTVEQGCNQEEQGEEMCPKPGGSLGRRHNLVLGSPLSSGEKAGLQHQKGSVSASAKEPGEQGCWGPQGLKVGEPRETDSREESTQPQ